MTDPTPLHTFAHTSHEQNIRPRIHPTSEPSDLQNFVRESRRVILDPVLAKLDPITDSEVEEVDVISQSCPLAPADRPRGRGGLFVKRKLALNEELKFPKDIDTSTSTVTPPPPEPTLKKSIRSRRLTTKARAREEGENIIGERPRKRRVKLILGPPPVPPSSSPPATPNLEPQSTSPQPLQDTQGSEDRAETYKQAWSVSEQHLLEQLLQEIPDGEKNRQVPDLSNAACLEYFSQLEEDF